MSRLQAYRDAAARQAVPQHVIDWSLELARPRIELRPAGGDGGPVVGQYGGRPSLPAHIEWSGFPEFIASVDLAALPAGVLDIPLPEDGHLLFFANRRDPTLIVEEDNRVVYVPAGTATAKTSDSIPLYGLVDWNMPGDCFDVVLADEEREGLFDQYELGYLDDSTAGELTLGGYACPVQDDPCHMRWPRGDAEAWLLLAQATFGYTDIPHHGVVFWMVRRQDLVERNFENVRLVSQSYL